MERREHASRRRRRRGHGLQAAGRKTGTPRGRKWTLLALALAVVLLAASALGSTRAALTYYSESYVAQMSTSWIGVSLLENGKIVSSRDFTDSGADDGFDYVEGTLLEGLLAEGETFQIGKTYQEDLAVQNTGEIDEYVRVCIDKRWTDGEGNTDTSLSPELIRLGLTGGWIEDTAASTRERTVLYYPNVLTAGSGAVSFADSIAVDSLALSSVREQTISENGKTTTTKTYAYDGSTFTLSAEVDAVQTHNARDAIKSAWGVDVTISADGTLSLQ